MTWSHGRRVRQMVQLLAFILYLYLVIAAVQQWVVYPLSDLFFRLNPLTSFTAMLAGREWLPRLGLASITLGLTLVLGRVWCGWLCPLGTLLDWLRFPGAKRRAKQVSLHWRLVKNILLLVILAMALFGSLSLLIFDPITLLTRAMTTVILPVFNYTITTIEHVLYPLPVLSSGVDWLESNVRGTVLPVNQRAFAYNALIAVLFFGVLALNLFADRFWCRYLCPLGAMLGLLSKVALFRPIVRSSTCISCAKCARVCPVEAIDSEPDYEIAAAECTVCLDCLAACPQNGMAFAVEKPAAWTQTDPTRRQVLASLGAGAVSVAILQTGLGAKHPDPHLLRPPGVESEDEFLSKCIRCSQCIAVCPTSGLQPALAEAGLEGFWTPHLVPRVGYCDYGCNACGQICPTQAIPALDLDAKRQMIIGLAAVDQSRCLPWAYDTPCIVCEEMCPVADKAIKLQEDGDLQKPVIIADLCIGCGICEHHCPMEGEAAIRVYGRV